MVLYLWRSGITGRPVDPTLLAAKDEENKWKCLKIKGNEI